MKKLLTSSIIFSILMITACSAQQSIEVTGTRFAKVTVTLPSPTETPPPTPSPESLLPQEVKEKFELAGVDPANMQNAEYDKDGLRITLPSEEVIVLTNTDLQKGIYNGQDNVLQYRDEANQNVIYAFDKESGKWEVALESTEAGAATIAILNELKVDLSTIELKMDGEEVVCIERATGNEVCRDRRFDMRFLVKNLSPDTLDRTNYKPVNGSRNDPPRALNAYLRKFFNDSTAILNDLFDGREYYATYKFMHDFSSEGGGYAWGFVFSDENFTGIYLGYRNVDGGIVIIPIFGISPMEVSASNGE